MSGDSRTVFVVLGESGEYSDRSVWVSGVFDTAEEAQRNIEGQLAVRRVWDAWQESYFRELHSAVPAGHFGCFTDEQREAARLRLPSEPPCERAERCEIEPIVVGKWT